MSNLAGFSYVETEARTEQRLARNFSGATQTPLRRADVPFVTPQGLLGGTPQLRSLSCLRPWVARVAGF